MAPFKINLKIADTLRTVCHIPGHIPSGVGYELCFHYAPPKHM